MDLAAMRFDPCRKVMRLQSLHPGVSTREIKEKTGFEISLPDRIRTTESPTVEELRVLRSQVGRDGIYAKNEETCEFAIVWRFLVHDFLLWLLPWGEE
jgi:hypothetical protein